MEKPNQKENPNLSPESLEKEENKDIQPILDIMEDATDIEFSSLEQFALKRFKKNLNLKLYVKLYIENEMDQIRRHIRLLKKTNRFYEELNSDLHSAKTEREVVNLLGEESELVQAWFKYNKKEDEKSA